MAKEVWQLAWAVRSARFPRIKVSSPKRSSLVDCHLILMKVCEGVYCDFTHFQRTYRFLKGKGAARTTFVWRDVKVF